MWLTRNNIELTVNYVNFFANVNYLKDNDLLSGSVECVNFLLNEKRFHSFFLSVK